MTVGPNSSNRFSRKPGTSRGLEGSLLSFSRSNGELLSKTGGLDFFRFSWFRKKIFRMSEAREFSNWFSDLVEEKNFSKEASSVFPCCRKKISRMSEAREFSNGLLELAVRFFSPELVLKIWNSASNFSKFPRLWHPPAFFVPRLIRSGNYKCG